MALDGLDCGFRESFIVNHFLLYLNEIVSLTSLIENVSNNKFKLILLL